MAIKALTNEKIRDLLKDGAGIHICMGKKQIIKAHRGKPPGCEFGECDGCGRPIGFEVDKRNSRYKVCFSCADHLMDIIGNFDIVQKVSGN